MSHHELEPGETCQTCGHRKPKKRTETSPDTLVVSIGRLPVDRHEILKDALDGLMDVTGATKLSYPKGSLIEALCVLGGLHQQELKEFFERDVMT